MNLVAELYGREISQSKRIELFKAFIESDYSSGLIDKDSVALEGIVIGVASGWVREEIEILTRILEAKTHQLQVFDINMFDSQKELQDAFDINESVNQTPIYLEFQNGSLTVFSQGFEAKLKMKQLEQGGAGQRR